jgi:tRNA threonylcarbamoyladenosine biosynthesis protein TsaE
VPEGAGHDVPVAPLAPLGPVVVETCSPAETRALGALLATFVAPGDVLLLSGGLGAGKTTLTKGIVAALGSDEEVTSPTFTLLRTYATTPTVAHVDCWRVEHVGEIVDLGLDELLDEGAVVVAEWGEAAAPLFGQDALLVRLAEPAQLEAADGSFDAERQSERRAVTLAATGPSWPDRLARIAAATRRERRKLQ